MREYAIIYREDDKVIRLRGLTYDQAKKKAKAHKSSIYMMNGVSSIRIS